MGKAKLIGGGVAVLALVLTFYFGYRHYTNLIKDKSIAEQTSVTLKNALDIESATVRDLRSATGAWKDSQSELLQIIEEMQENTNAAEQETKRLRRELPAIDWSSASADSIANAIIDRLWRNVATATERGHDRIGAPDSTTVAEPDTSRADESRVDGHSN